jgi:hypothetical protein
LNKDNKRSHFAAISGKSKPPNNPTRSRPDAPCIDAKDDLERLTLCFETSIAALPSRRHLRHPH